MPDSGELAAAIRCEPPDPCFYTPKISPGTRLTIAHAEIESLVIRRDQADRVESIYIKFSSDDFDDVLRALQGKYKGIKCENSQVQSGLGASFKQTHCHYTDKQGFLRAVRRDSTVNDATLMMMSHQAIKARAQADKRKGPDL